jgi:hypothetical protein
MRVPTLRQIDSALRRYGWQALAGILGSLGIFFRDLLIGFLVQVPSQGLATAVVWLAIAVLVIALVGTFYIIKSRKLEKAVLKFDPHFYEHLEFDEAWDEAAKNA